MPKTCRGALPELCSKRTYSLTQSEQICPCSAILSNVSRSQNTANIFGICGSRYRTKNRLKPHTTGQFAEELSLAHRLLKQQQHDRNNLYSLHAPEVECLAKGKAHKRYEFGVKVSIAATNKSNFVVGAMALSGNPYDGHTLSGALELVRRMSGQRIDEVSVDRGYRGHGESLSEVYISGQKRGITTQRLKRSLKRRQAIEPIIGHLKSDGLLGRNYLKGTLGDQMNVLLCCAGHSLRLVLRRLRFFVSNFGDCFGCRYAVGKRQIVSSQKSIPMHDGYRVDQQIRSRLNCFQPLGKWIFQDRRISSEMPKLSKAH